MQTSNNMKMLLKKCTQRLRIFVDGISNAGIGIFMLREDDFSSDDVLDAEYEILGDGH